LNKILQKENANL